MKLGKAADEGPELLILPGGQSSHGAILHLIIDRIVRGVNLGRQECQEQVEEIDGKGVGDCILAVSSLRSISGRLRIGLEVRRTDVPALRDEDAGGEDDQQEASGSPSVGDEWGGLIQDCLESLNGVY